MTPPASTGTTRSTSWSRFFVRFVWGAAIFYALSLAVGAGLAYWTARPSMCTMCHEMQHNVTTWQTSPHANIGCPACHEPVRAWYRFPETFAFRAQMLKRDWDAHQANPNASVLATQSVSMRPIPDANCLQCHDLVRAVTLPSSLVMDHAKHVARNKSCISCHRWTAHPPPASQQPLLLMAQCFNCHGRNPGAKAPGTCTTCHPKSLPPRPPSHTPAADWLAGHGPIAKVDRQPCAMCHDDSFCRGCHKIDMPHPAGWVKGPGVTHPQFAKQHPEVCVQCHGPEPNLCSMCHHKGLSASAGPWASHHAPTVDKFGPSFCFKCHDALFCFGCHGQPNGPPGAPPAPAALTATSS